MIVKIQRPIHSTGPPQALIYDEPREFEVLLPFQGEVAGLFVPEPQDRLKLYAEVHVEDSLLVIDRILAEDEEPDW